MTSLPAVAFAEALFNVEWLGTRERASQLRRAGGCQSAAGRHRIDSSAGLCRETDAYCRALSVARGLDDLDEAARIEAGAADERAVDVRLAGVQQEATA